MEFFQRPATPPARLGVFPGSFNPPTIAHQELAHAALAHVDEVAFVLPRVFPHKSYRDTTLEQRIELLRDAFRHEPQISIAVAEGGLFIEIARECRAAYGAEVQLSFLCGRDAAERIVAWDYGRTGAWEEMLLEFDLLVAPRAGEYRPEPAQVGRFRQIAIHPECDAISASEVRRRIAHGEPWEQLVPPAIRARVREFYT
jgi:nicotinate (nicotinamide) nucleotide adenylyltransferase